MSSNQAGAAAVAHVNVNLKSTITAIARDRGTTVEDM
jgi:hypothetical protein